MHGDAEDVELTEAVWASAGSGAVLAGPSSLSFDDVHVGRQMTVGVAGPQRLVSFLALHFDLDASGTDIVAEEEVIRMIAGGRFVLPPFEVFDDGDFERGFGNHAADTAQGQIAGAVNGFTDDFGLSVELLFDFMDREFEAKTVENLFPLLPSATVKRFENLVDLVRHGGGFVVFRLVLGGSPRRPF